MSYLLIDATGKMFSSVCKKVKPVQNFSRHSLERVRLYWGDGRIILRYILVYWDVRLESGGIGCGYLQRRGVGVGVAGDLYFRWLKFWSLLGVFLVVVSRMEWRTSPRSLTLLSSRTTFPSSEACIYCTNIFPFSVAKFACEQSSVA